MENVEFDIIRENKGRVRIVPKMGRLPSLQQYTQVAKTLLENGFRNEGKEKLKDSGSQDILDCMQLIQEFGEDFGDEVKTVVFSYRAGDVQVTANNVDQIPNIVKNLERKEGNMYQRHRTAIKEAVAEALEK